MTAAVGLRRAGILVATPAQLGKQLARPMVALLGEDHFLEPNNAVDFLLEHVLDPAVCCYGCEHRVVAECLPLYKHDHDARLPSFGGSVRHPDRHLTIRGVEDARSTTGGRPPVVEVREPAGTATLDRADEVCHPPRVVGVRLPWLLHPERSLQPAASRSQLAAFSYAD